VSGQPVCASYNLVTVSDCNGAHVLRYLQLCDGRYFGGNTWDRADGFAGGIHEMRTLGGMLDLIGKIANAELKPFEFYAVEGAGGIMQVSREMSAAMLAAVLGCDEQAVRDHFAPLVSLA
jgi:hypothetical protein